MHSQIFVTCNQTLFVCTLQTCRTIGFPARIPPAAAPRDLCVFIPVYFATRPPSISEKNCEFWKSYQGKHKSMVLVTTLNRAKEPHAMELQNQPDPLADYLKLWGLEMYISQFKGKSYLLYSDCKQVSGSVLCIHMYLINAYTIDMLFCRTLHWCRNLANVIGKWH